MKRKFIVYMHKCLICERSNGIYIGITCQSPSHRWLSDGHGYLTLNYLTGDYTQPKIAFALLKYGLENWTNEKVWTHKVLLEGLTKEEAEQKEIELIDFYNSYEDGLNGTRGGGGHLKYLTEEEALAAKKISVDKAHKKWNENPANKDKDRAIHHRHYLKEMSDPEKYAQRLAWKAKANAKRKLDSEKYQKDAVCKLESQRKLRAQLIEIRQQLNEKQDLLTEEQYKIVFTRKGSHYKCNSVKILGEILKSIEEADN